MSNTDFDVVTPRGIMQSVRCNQCMWRGLVTPDTEACPHCGRTGFLMDFPAPEPLKEHDLRGKSENDAFVEALTYYQKKLAATEEKYRTLSAKVDAFIGQFTEEEITCARI